MNDDRQVYEMVIRILNNMKLDDEQFDRIYNVVEYAYKMGLMQGHMDMIKKQTEEMRKQREEDDR